MVFTSHIFLFYFLPAVLLGYYLLPADNRLRNGWLLAASIVFYGWANPRNLILLLFVTVVNHSAAILISRPDAGKNFRRCVVGLSVACTLGLLVRYKHLGFLQESLNSVLSLLGRGERVDVVKLVLPIGISFYVFQAISYTVDVYRGVAKKARSIMDFACFLAMFPQLVAGPILTFHSMAGSLSDRTHSSSLFAKGAALFILGFAKKMLLANPVAEMADLAFAARSPDCAVAWAGACAYALQIYFDFSGYSDMAIGLGRMFGFEFDRNFDRPYASASVGEFWRRWHMTLGAFLREYLYIPLGGSRKGSKRTALNLFLVMLLGGLWHGANWTFVAWGMLHGAALATERLVAGWRWMPAIPRPLAVVRTFLVVLVSWVFFRSETLGDAIRHLTAMAGWGAAAASNGPLHTLVFQPAPVFTALLGLAVLFWRHQAYDFCERLTGLRKALLLVLFVLALLPVYGLSSNPFLYFQF